VQADQTSAGIGTFTPPVNTGVIAAVQANQVSSATGFFSAVTNRIKVGAGSVTTVKVGDTTVTRMYVGSTSVWP
jgi:hypothetical protein